MNIRRAPKKHDSIPSELFDRCEELGLACWRLDLNGMPIEDPVAPSMLGLFLSARSIRMLIVQAAMIWSTLDSLEPQEVHPGLWLFPFIEEHRDRRTGYFVAIGFGPEVLESEHIAEGCAGNQLQVSALRHLLKERAVYGVEHTTHTYATLAWMLDDLNTLAKNESTIELFSEQLGDSYEVVTTLQDLGRSMGSLDDPSGIIFDGISEIAATLDYNWVACVINKEHAVSQVIDSTFHQAGITQLADSEIQQLLKHIETTEPLGVADTTAIYPVEPGMADLEPQILVHPITRDGEDLGFLIAGGKNGDDPQVSSHETKLLESISGMLGACMENAELYHRQHKTFIGTVKALSAAIDAKDQYTQGHSERVAMLSEMLALQVGYSEEEAERIRISGLVHDVGKIGVPEAVLCKPGRLTDEEFDAIKTHPRIGYEIMKEIPDLHDILPGVLHHHERWDGNGYPGKLAGEDIPRMARIMALADTFDAMSSNRAYRTGMSRDKVFAEFVKCAGTQFDPDLVEPFLALDFGVYDSMVAKHKAQAPIQQAA
ncbi:MAG: HD-GYP domain-containing protein [Phycisphaerales bacterium]|nr:HD-GYP domain-containing protein [Phycisphaerales bacterium]